MIGALGLTTVDDDIDGRLPEEFQNPAAKPGAPKTAPRSKRVEEGRQKNEGEQPV